MESTIVCPGCQRPLRIPETLRGKRIRCRCGHTLATDAPTKASFPPVSFYFRIKDDPDDSLSGVYRAEANADGLECRRPKAKPFEIARGAMARYLGKNLIALELDERDVTVAVEQLNMYPELLARDVVRFLQGKKDALIAQDYKVPWYLLAAGLFPVGILAIGILGGALGGALGGCIAGGLFGVNLNIIRRHRWAMVARLAAVLGLSLLG